MKRNKFLIELFFCIGIGVLLLSGLGRTLFFAKDINYYENRPANRVHQFSVDAFLDASFQDSFEKALADQVVFAQRLKADYNLVDSSYIFSLVSNFSKTVPDKYVPLYSLALIGGENLVNWPAALDDVKDSLDRRISNMNTIIFDHPDLDFYVYYIENDGDINFETGEKAGVYEYLSSKLDISNKHIDAFTIDDFETYKKYFFQTDHHWKNNGSYAGYLDICALLNTENVIAPLEEVTLPYRLSGSKAATVRGTNVFTEPFFAYRFDFPQMDITVPGNPAVSDYGRQEDFFAGRAKGISYGAFYGGDLGEIVFDMHQPGKRRMLVLGDSYDNAILKLLVGHCDTLFSVDLRSFEDFAFSEYVIEHDIDTVLFVGNRSYFASEDFLIQE